MESCLAILFLGLCVCHGLHIANAAPVNCQTRLKGTKPGQGRAEVHLNGEWKSICATEGFKYGNQPWVLFCKTLGFNKVVRHKKCSDKNVDCNTDADKLPFQQPSYLHRCEEMKVGCHPDDNAWIECGCEDASEHPKQTAKCVYSN